jgi:serine/threonine protein kinase
MSPEQAKGKPVDKRADIWAFGVVLAEMLTGRQLYTGETISEVLATVLLKEPGLDTLPTDTPAGIRSLLRRALEKDPKQRLRDIGDARLEVDDAMAEPAQPLAAAGARPRKLLYLIPIAVLPSEGHARGRRGKCRFQSS